MASFSINDPHHIPPPFWGRKTARRVLPVQSRTNAPQADHKYAGRLSEDKGLSRAEVLRAITMNSSYELHQDQSTGSLEIGKLADLIVLDRKFLDIPAEQIADIQVLQTMVGGRVVYQSDKFTAR